MALRALPAVALLLFPTTLYAGPAAAAVPASVQPDRYQTFRTQRPVAPGVAVEQVETFDGRGWQQGNALTVDLTKGARIGYLSPGTLTAPKPIDEQANAAGAVAAFNADFFDINNSGAPLGPAIDDGKLVKSQSEDPYRAVGFDASGAARILEVLFDGSVTLPTGVLKLDRLNSPLLNTGETEAFTELWGSYPRSRAVQGATRVAEVVVEGNVVKELRTTAGDGPVPPGSTILLGREAGADALSVLKPGDPVSVTYQPRTSDGSTLQTAVGAHTLLVSGGAVQPGLDDTVYAGRTALGFSQDGKKLYLLTMDSDRRTHSRGATLAEMGRLLAERGAYAGVELDGGGSTTLATRRPGETQVRVDNTPGDGEVRPVPNGLAVFAPQGSGNPSGIWVDTADPRTAPGDAPVQGGRPDRVFTGLHRALTATPYDEVYGPAKAGSRLRWEAGRGWVHDGMYRAAAPGRTTVTARVGPAYGTKELDVLGPAVRIAPETDELNVPTATDTGTIGLVGFDAQGNSAPIDPVDVELSYDQTLFDVQPSADGQFVVRSLRESGAGIVTAKVGELETQVAVSVGVEKTVLDTFDTTAGWTAGSARASVTVNPTPDGEDGAGLKLSYDFTQTTLTRNAIAVSPAPLGPDKQAQAFGVSVYGHGKGEWTALGVVDATGRATALYGPYVTWNGWQTVELAVPAGLPQPVKLRRIYTLETKASAQYTGEVTLDNAYVKAAPSVALPAKPRLTDPLVQTARAVDGRDWRFAVMSDSQFVGRDPDSAIVRSARRTLQEIKAAKPDFFIIDGDFVDEANDIDLQLAKRILDEEIGTSVPYYYVPGNHEVMGAPITNFKKYFGDTHRVFDHRGTRFITLDSSGGTLRSGGFDQLQMLRGALDAAASDAGITSVVVAEHHPPRDPTPAKNSQLGDRHEAALLEQWLAGFQRTTGKGALFVGGHVGTFHASRVDGVPYLINGNSGKAPATDPADGGFTGWTLFGVDNASRPSDWVSAQVRPHVDALTVTAPATLRAGDTAPVSAIIAQGNRQFPLGFPVSADWSTSKNLRYDAASGTVRALWRAPATISVTVNGTTSTATLQVT